MIIQQLKNNGEIGKGIVNAKWTGSTGFFHNVTGQKVKNYKCAEYANSLFCKLVDGDNYGPEIEITRDNIKEILGCENIIFCNGYYLGKQNYTYVASDQFLADHNLI